MKKLILIVVISTFPVLGYSQTSQSNAQKQNKCIKAQVKANDVKMYRQAGTSSEIILSLQTTDDVLYHRKLNNTWAVVTVGDKVGYVLYEELTNKAIPTPDPQVVAMQKKRK